MADKAKADPEFDPSKPFEPVPEPEAAEFDPAQPFESVAPPEQPGLGEKLLGFGKRMFKESLAPIADLITTPLEELDKVAGAPLRAGMGAIQRGGGFEGGRNAAVEQLRAGLPSVGEQGGLRPGQVLPTTPTGEDIALKGMIGQGIDRPFAEDMAPMVGAGVEATLDATQLIPGEAALSALKGVGKGAKVAGKVAAKGYKAAEGLAARGIANTASRFTRVLPADKAMQMYRDLTAWEMLFPGTKQYGRASEAMKAVGEARAAFRDKPIAVPGSHEAMMRVKAAVQQGAYRAGKNEGSIQVLQMIEERAFEPVEIIEDVPLTLDEISPSLNQAKDEISNALREADKIQSETGRNIWAEDSKLNRQFQERVDQVKHMEQLATQGGLTRRNVRVEMRPKDLTLDELDDIYRRYNSMQYTPLGNARALDPVWEPFVREARALTDEIMQSIPEGELFKKTKRRAESLMIAGKERSQLVELGADLESVRAIKDLAQGNIVSATIGGLTQMVTPKGFVSLLAATRAPRDVAAKLQAAYNSRGLKAMRDAVAEVAEAYPMVAERFVRGAVLLTGKPTLQQYITPEEADTLGATRIFDPAQVAAERDRVLNDQDMPSTQRQKILSDINRNGYIIMPGKAPTPETPAAPAETPAKAGLDILLKKLTPTAAPLGEPSPEDQARLDPMSAPIPAGVKVKEKWEDMLAKGIQSPTAQKFPGLAAGLATAGSLAGDLLIPTSGADLAAIPPGWKVIKGGGEAATGAKGALKEAVKPLPTSVSRLPGLSDEIAAVEKTKSAFERVMDRFGGDEHVVGKKIRQYVTKMADGSEPYFGYAIENPAWIEKKGQMSSLPQPIPVDFRSIDPKGHLGKGVATGKADPFSWLESKYGVSKKILEEHAGKPLKISTRSDLIAHEDYLELLDPKLHEVEFHVFSDNARINRVVLPGAPSVQRIMTAVERLQERGVKVTLVHDVVKGMPEESNALRPFVLKQETGIKKVPPIRENVIEPEGDGIFRATGIKPEDP